MGGKLVILRRSILLEVSKDFKTVFKKFIPKVYSKILRHTKEDCMFLSCHVCVSEWIQTLYLPEYQRIPCSKQAWNLKFKWMQLDNECNEPTTI